MKAFAFNCPRCDDTWTVLETDLDGEPKEKCGLCGFELEVYEREVSSEEAEA